VVLRNMTREGFWAEEPEGDYVRMIFDRFLGGEPFVKVLAALLCLAALFRAVAGRPPAEDERGGPASEPEWRFVLPLLFSWIFVCIFLPYLRSITGTPMLVPRYEIVILPALLVLMALGLSALRHPLLIGVAASIFAFAAGAGILLVDDYFGTVKKEQLREAALFVAAEENARSEAERRLVLSDIAGFYNAYFELLDADLRARPLFAGDLRALPEAMANKGIWVITGHREGPPPEAKGLVEHGFSLRSEGRFHLAWAGLFILPDPPDGREGL